MKNLDRDIEEFYEIFEKGGINYTRPKDYKERAKRVINRFSKKCDIDKEGKKGGSHVKY